jgi:hypothetical protein
MRVLAGIALWVLFVVGMVIGLVLGVLVVFWVSLIRGKRAVHFEGVVCRGELRMPNGPVGTLVEGPVLARLSGAMASQTSSSDILGIAVCMQKADRTDQMIVFGTFEGFLSALRDKANTNAGDYIRNKYSSVTPWWTPGKGPATWRLGLPQIAAAEGSDRLARLDADLAADRARFKISVDGDEVAELRLVERLPDAPEIRISMFRTGRGIRPVGLRNGIRATVYPIGQLGRRIRGA